MQLKVDQIAQEKGYSIRRLSRESGVSYQTVHDAWRNRTTPSLMTLEKLAVTLGVEVRDLIEG